MAVPSRSTTIGTLPCTLRMAAAMSSNVDTGVSPTLTMTSPGRIPASAAGPGPVQSASLPGATSGATQAVSPTIALVGGCRLGSPQIRAMA